MDPRDFYIQQKVCWERGITVYPKPTNKRRHYRIVICRNGREKVGEEIYTDKAYEKIVIDKSSGVIKKNVQLIPSVWDKMLMIYDDIYKKNFFGMKPLPGVQPPYYKR